MNIQPCTLRQANEYLKLFHRHSKKVAGCKFSICAYKDNKLVGVAIVGRPVARKLDDGLTGEILRTCTDGTKNVNSFLYGACQRIWKEMGGSKIITYTLDTESGISLRAAGFVIARVAPGYYMQDWVPRDKVQRARHGTCQSSQRCHYIHRKWTVVC